MAKAKTYTVQAEQIIAHGVWNKGDTISSDDLDRLPETVAKQLVSANLLVEVVETAPASGG